MAKPMVATRREWMRNGFGLIGVGTALPDFLIRTALAGPDAEQGQRVLVVLQLDGGNDTLNTLIPYGHAEYHEYRGSATHIPEKEVIRIDAELGFHPYLTGWKELLDQGWFAGVHGVGYPNPNFSHFESTNIWMMGDTRGRKVPHGWIGRACDVGFPDHPDPKLAVAVGPNNGAALALRGRQHAGILVDRPDAFKFSGGDDDREAAAYRALNQFEGAQSTNELDWVARTAMTASSASEEISRLGTAYQPKVEYPDTSYGKNLRAIAGLISGGLSTRIYWTSRSGRLEFDTHSNQRPKHDNLLKELDGAISAFFRDLRAQGQAERVLLMTVSEFGRTAKENGNKGTDHAAGAAQFLFGPGVRPGFHGKHPSLKAADLMPVASALPFAIDFRSIYATVLERWMGIPSEPVLGSPFPLVDCIA